MNLSRELQSPCPGYSKSGRFEMIYERRSSYKKPSKAGNFNLQKLQPRRAADVLGWPSYMAGGSYFSWAVHLWLLKI